MLFVLFVLLCVAFAWNNLDDPFTGAPLITLGAMIACPLITGVLASRDNRDYDRRWYCDSCGELWTQPDLGNGTGVPV